jgi:hypothetical protein
MEIYGKIHFPVALHPGKSPFERIVIGPQNPDTLRILIGPQNPESRHVGGSYWAPEPVWTRWKVTKCLPLLGIHSRFPCLSAHRLPRILTQTSVFMLVTCL